MIDPATGKFVKMSVWSVATELDGQFLIYAWSPCGIENATVTVPGFGDAPISMGYTLVGEKPVPPPKPIRILKGTLNGKPDTVFEVFEEIVPE